MAPARSRGPVEAAYKAWVDSLTALDLRQQAGVQQLLSLARRMDAASDEPLSAAATCSRELRAVCDELRDAAHVGAQTPDGAEPAQPEAAPDGVADIRSARAKRLRDAGAS